jgi:lipopolysaccharide exporter
MPGKFVKNVAVLATGTVFAQLIAMLAAPILSRLYTPEQFGGYGAFITVVGLFSTIAAFSYEMAIVKQAKEEQADHLFQTCIIISLTTSVIFFLLLQVFDRFTEMSFVKFIPIAMFLYAVNNAIYSLLNRYEMYTLLSKVQAFRSGVIVALQIICGYFGYTHYGLVVGILVSSLVICFYSYSQFLVSHKIKSFVSKKALKKLIITNLDFARFGVPQNMMSYLSANSPVLIIGVYYNLTAVGAYFFAVKIVQIPANFLGAAVKRVFYRKAEVLSSDPNSISELYNKMTLTMTAMITPVVLFWFIYAEKIFPLVFGDEWLTAAIFSKWLLIWFGAQFVMAPTRSLFLVFNIQKYLLIFDTSLGVFRFVVLILLAQNFRVEEVVKIYSLLSAFISICFVVGWYVYLTRQRNLIQPS